MNAEFSDRVLTWFDAHGRKDLPWQRRPTCYSAWVSEIMLQQTQVVTVIPYYVRFMRRFPDVAALADADIDEVLHHWSGLGYYARARNLHRAARLIVAEHAGELPTEAAALIALPGIGRSTAGAILSLALGQPLPILDGNVKRVLARCFAIEGWPGQAAVLRQLWTLAEYLTPTTHTARYNQAMMDLGATLCRRGRPDCERCPLWDECIARRDQRQLELPAKRPRKILPVRGAQMLVARDLDGRVLLRQRPPSGVWGGLWSLPEGNIDELARNFPGIDTRKARHLATRRHTFSHFHLDITPLVIDLVQPMEVVMDAPDLLWYNGDQPERIGLAAPVSRILQELEEA